MPKRSSKRPRDLNVLAKTISKIATEGEPEPIDDGKNPHAVALGRMGGLKGGKARAKILPEKRRKEIALKAAKARWSNRKS